MESIETFFSTQLALLGVGEWRIGGHPLSAYLASLLVFVGAFLSFKLVQHVVIARLRRLAERTPTELDDTLVKLVESFRPPFYAFLAFWLAVQYLGASGFWHKLLTAAVILWATYQAVIVFSIFIEDIVLRRLGPREDPTTQSALRLLANLAKGALWGIGVLLLLSNLGVNITSLLAGVGIGGIAIAFAVQGILSDLFNSFSLYFDKPFEVGDFVVLPDGKMGTVKHIGMKSTRLTSLTGEEIVVPNSTLTGSTIQNYKRMQERRASFTVGITYDTPPEQVAHAVELIKEAISSQHDVRLDRVHFVRFGDSALIIEAVYYLLRPDYNFYMDTQQAINLAIHRSFAAAGIEMAYPTRTVYLRGSGASENH